MYGLSPVVEGVILSAIGVVGLVVGGLYWYRFENELDDQLEARLEESESVDFEPPSVSSSPLDYFRAMRHLQFQRKAAKKGYVKWYLVGSSMQRPRWVKPKAEGKGVMEYKHDGTRYLFDKDAMTTDAQTGAWVAMHMEGECDPMNISDPPYPGMEGDLLEKIVNMAAESKPPGWLDGVFGGMSTQTMMWLAVGGLFVVYAAFRYMNGGL